MLIFNLIAQISNPALGAGLGGAPSDSADSYTGVLLTTYIATFWRTLITLGGLAAVAYFLLGAFDWITAGGEQGKIDSARKKMTQSIVGIAILAATVALVEFVSTLLGFDLLELSFPRLLN